MARKNTGELLDDLATTSIRHDVLLNVASDEITLLRNQHESFVQSVNAIKVDLARVQNQTDELRTQVANRTTRAWSLVTAVLAAVLGATLTYVVQRFLLGK